jgi:DNA polymerase III epsilon subunit-like protein
MEASLQERYVLVFDFETNALPHESVTWDNFRIKDVPRFSADGSPARHWQTGEPLIMKASDHLKWPHTVQFAYILYDNKENKAKVVNELVRLPDGVEMSEESEAIHKISKAMTQGKTKTVVDLKTGRKRKTYHPEVDVVLREFMKDFKIADVVVAHNIKFDRNMLLAEMSRKRPEFEEELEAVFSNKKEYCTAQFGAEVCKIKATNRVGEVYYRMPKLSGLYEHLFGLELDPGHLHDALVDVVICLRCFYKMRYGVDLMTMDDLDPTVHSYLRKLSDGPAKKKVDDLLQTLRRSDRLSTVPVKSYKETVAAKKTSKSTKKTRSQNPKKHSKKN